MEILKESLLNDDGSLNEWSLKELSDAIENMPKSYERLAGDPEWSLKKDQWTFAHSITGAFAKYAIIQSPFGVPQGLETVCNYLHSELLKRICWDKAVPLYEDGRNGKQMVELSLCEINKLLHEILYETAVAEFDDWNKTKPDFIDLDALLHNVCLDIRTERREFRAFNEKFDKQMEMDNALQIESAQ